MGQNRELFQAYEVLIASPSCQPMAQKPSSNMPCATSACRYRPAGRPSRSRYAEVQSKPGAGQPFLQPAARRHPGLTKHVTDEAALAGLTESAKAQMAAAAQAKGLDGRLISLEYPQLLRRDDQRPRPCPARRTVRGLPAPAPDQFATPASSTTTR